MQDGDAKSSIYKKESKRKKHLSTKRNCIAVPKVKIPTTIIKPTTMEMEQKIMQKQRIFKASQKAAMSMLVMTIMIALIFVFMKTNDYVFAVEAYIDGQSIGIADKTKEIDECLKIVVASKSMEIGKEVMVEQKPIFTGKIVKTEALTPMEDIEKNIESIIHMNVEAISIDVDGKQMGLAKDINTVEEILDELQAPYRSDDQNVTVGFNKKVQIKKQVVPIEELDEKEEILFVLSGMESEIEKYQIKNGDTLWDIALDHKIPVEEILRINPQMSEIIQPGDKINLTVPKPILGIEVREKVVYNEDIAYDIEEVEDETLYEGRRTIVDRGINGEKEVEAEIIKVNGIEIDKNVIKETVLAEPKAQTEKVGTKPLPPKYGTGTFRRPIYATITSRFGTRWGRMHTGIDYGGSVGDPVYAADGGKVIFAGWDGSYGYIVKISHDNEYVTYYAHCSKLLVSTGQRVAKGQLIAKVGNTGRSTGPHLHFEVRKNGTPVNPLSYLP